ncbi:acyltransferase [Bariatricus sp. HCP28S3_D3]|uniref:acyltransferase n=1 Tax=Bariatricus sp. HCP28S3_D3 TaxID=3438901 RepID=UPI003F8C0383
MPKNGVSGRAGGGNASCAELEVLKSRGLRIGEHVDIFTEYPFDSIYPGLITIGDYVTISSDVKILAHDASMGYITDGACKIGRVDIGSHVFIGHGAIILCNTRIGDYAVIGAGSVVTGDVPARTVYAGNPARYIKSIDEFAAQNIKAMDTYAQFTRPWREWQNLDEEEWRDVRNVLKENYGYVIRKK